MMAAAKGRSMKAKTQVFETTRPAWTAKCLSCGWWFPCLPSKVAADAQAKDHRCKQEGRKA
jgi:hypothetical protein